MAMIPVVRLGSVAQDDDDDENESLRVGFEKF